ncbi:hypothetical protein V494_01133, partial [Pseudogymnoascus sp. VKM F-4513 (FW-928)]
MASTTTTTTTAGTTTTGTADIDALLTTYLDLLHTYTILRGKLTALQASTSLSLTRARITTPHLTVTGYSAGTNRLYASASARVRVRGSPPSETGRGAGEGEEEGEEEVFSLIPVERAATPESAEDDDDDDEDDDEKDEKDSAEDADGDDANTDTSSPPSQTQT